ncbi:hypothetical protein [Rhodococcus sp. CH91]|uniref:hypothetical protein n=1 Tax=Rhodococcus sp. CH91 TaxID=2910256 RepID=UPI001F4B4F7A|nr:hypothetical protein [Rhodococcus sp. CH91]
MSGDRARPRDEVTDEQKASRARIDRARLARIFGDVLPDTTRDERGEGDSAGGGAEEWLRRQVPPHHGG